MSYAAPILQSKAMILAHKPESLILSQSPLEPTFYEKSLRGVNIFRGPER
jgi:hypothetical protein